MQAWKIAKDSTEQSAKTCALDDRWVFALEDFGASGVEF